MSEVCCGPDSFGGEDTPHAPSAETLRRELEESVSARLAAAAPKPGIDPSSVVGPSPSYVGGRVESLAPNTSHPVYDHVPGPGGKWICGHKFETHGSVYEADRCYLSETLPKDHAVMRASLREMADTAGVAPDHLRERVHALTTELGTVYREHDELLALAERLIRQDRLAHANLTEAQRASNRDQQAAREARAEVRELNERLVSLQDDRFFLKMPRWVCPKCGTFNGEARMILRECRSGCGTPRPDTSESPNPVT